MPLIWIFCPLITERFDLIIPEEYYDSELLGPVFELLEDPKFKKAVSERPRLPDRGNGEDSGCPAGEGGLSQPTGELILDHLIILEFDICSQIYILVYNGCDLKKKFLEEDRWQ